MSERPEWFAPKSHGLGAGLPIAWQGWALTFAFIAIVSASAFFVERSPWAAGSVIFTATAVFLIICAKTTRGGWRWRWGGRD